MTLLIIFFLSLSLSIVATPLLITYFTKRGIVDKPDNVRRIHKAVTPRMGGIVIIVGTLIMLFSFFQDLNDARLFIFGLLIITFVGVIDDVIGIRYSYKFAFQILVAFIIMFDMNLFNLGVDLFTIPFIPALGNLIIVLFIVGTINSINLMDGLDGLVSGYSIPKFLVLFGLAIIHQDTFLAILLIALLGSIIGFLKYNANPASIFLGDTGSLSIGYFLVYSVLKISLYKYNVNGSLNMTFAIMILSVPILDTLKVMLLRLANKQNPFAPDKTHLHHLLFGQNLKQKTVVFVLHLFSLAFIFVALIYYKESEKYGIVFWLVTSTLLLNSRNILRYFKEQGFFTTVFDVIEKYVGKMVIVSKKNIIALSIIPTAFLLFFSALHRQNYESHIIFIAVLFGGILFFMSLFLNKRYKLNNYIFVYLNLTMFFVFSFFKSELMIWDLIEKKQMVFISLILIMFLIILFSFARKIVISNTEMVFTGFDLSIIVSTIAVVLADNFFLPQSYSFIVPSLVLSLTLYLWIKIVVNVDKRLDKAVYYVSFALPVILLLFSIK
jgi:UDP-GlcNAc:undecaprenyl-phosphate GlcNAc-1-phosphate transferase